MEEQQITKYEKLSIIKENIPARIQPFNLKDNLTQTGTKSDILTTKKELHL